MKVSEDFRNLEYLWLTKGQKSDIMAIMRAFV